jgi:hypothetical protein
MAIYDSYRERLEPATDNVIPINIQEPRSRVFIHTTPMPEGKRERRIFILRSVAKMEGKGRDYVKMLIDKNIVYRGITVDEVFPPEED